MVECPDGRYTSELFQTAMENFDLWKGMFCAYGAPLGELVVGTVLYAAVGLNIFIRTESVMIPFVLALILGGTILGQMFAVINSFVAIIILFAAPVVVSALIVTMEKRGLLCRCLSWRRGSSLRFWALLATRSPTGWCGPRRVAARSSICGG